MLYKKGPNGPISDFWRNYDCLDYVLSNDIKIYSWFDWFSWSSDIYIFWQMYCKYNLQWDGRQLCSGGSFAARMAQSPVEESSPQYLYA